MNRIEAENFVYKSYLKAEKYQDYNAKDSKKRNPNLSKEIIRTKAKTPCVLVTGSKGKGSTANMVSQILQSKYKVGLMTSPHISNFCERFKINGVNISDDDFAKYMTMIQPKIDDIDSKIPKNICISPMGIQTDLGLTFFNDQHTEFNVLECGKGARYDDVNNAVHQYAIINSIFLEHKRELGNTLEAIAEDKSYVINGEQKCIYIAEQSDNVINVIKKRADKFSTPIKIYGKDFKAINIRYANNGMNFDVIICNKIYKNIMIPLMGEHQARNCALAMAFCKDVLGDFDVEIVKDKLANIDWPGRMEIISKNPFIMLDACINSASCINVKNVLKKLKIENPTVIIGIPNDKDYAGVIKAMSEVSNNIILTNSQNPHYVFTNEQCKNMDAKGIKTIWTDSVDKAIDKAREKELPIIILGTTSVVSKVKEYQFKNL